MYLNTENIDIVEEDGKDEKVPGNEEVAENISSPDLDTKGQDYGLRCSCDYKFHFKTLKKINNIPKHLK